MPLYRKQKPKIFKTDDVLVGNTNSPLAFQQPVPERNVDFDNAKPTPSDYNEFVITALQSVQSQATILGTNLPVLNKEATTERYIKPIFMGSPNNPSDEFLYANAGRTLDFESNANCETVFLFANLQAKKSDRGFNKIVDKKDKNIPNTITDSLPSDTNQKYQLMFVEQTDNDTKIKINAYDLVVENAGKGIGTVIQSPIQLDTWFNKKLSENDVPTGRNGRWVDYNIGDNVTVGATNDKLNNRKIGERFDWSFGSIFLAKTFGSTVRNPDETYREIKYTFENGRIILSDWDFVIADSPTTYTDRYTTKAKLIADNMPLVDIEKLTKEEINSGVVGRKIYTYLIKSFEEGECIRIEEVYGGIRINVDFNYNGRCCDRLVTSVSSAPDECFSLLPGNVNEYEVNDGKVCVNFEGEDSEIGYINICGDEIPVSTINGFLAWNYGTQDEYIFNVFKECQGFYTSSGCYYEVCFTGYPAIQFTVQVLSISTSSSSSASYSSASSSSSSISSGGTSSSSSSVRDLSSSSLSTSLSSKSDKSSSSSFSSLSRSSLSSSGSSVSFSGSSVSDASGSSDSSKSNSSRSTSSSGDLLSSQSDSSISDTSASETSMSDVSSSSSPSASKSSRSNSSSSSSVSSNSSSQSYIIPELSIQSISSESSNVPLDWGIIYPTGSYKMNKLGKFYSSSTQSYDSGIVVGDCYGLIEGTLPFQNAFTFSLSGDILAYFSESEQATSYASSVDTSYYSTLDSNLILMGGNFSVATSDISGNPLILNSPIYLSNQDFTQKYSLNVDDDNNPFENLGETTSVNAQCVKFFDNFLFICGPITYNSKTGFHGYPIVSVDIGNQLVTCTASGAVYNYDVNVGGGSIWDLNPSDNFQSTFDILAVGEFSTPRRGIMNIGANSLSNFNYELVGRPGFPSGTGYGYTTIIINTLDQERSSSSRSSRSESSVSSDSTISISESSKSFSSNSLSSFSLSYSSISGFSSVSSNSESSSHSDNSSSSISSSSNSENSSSSSPSSNSLSSYSESRSSLSGVSVSSNSNVSVSSNSISSDSEASFGHTNRTLIVAGNFDNVYDRVGLVNYPRYNLAFFTSTGILLSYRIISSINGAIRKVIYDEETQLLYLAGEFTSVQDTHGNTYSPNFLMAFRIDPLTDMYSYVPINVNPDNVVYDMSIMENRIYICGNFQGINSKYRPGIGAFNRYAYYVY
jgi:hypothetical protein